ncbi:hypothetical protein, partial [Pseudomonas syringae group genomosp. 7]|uniref:hypothetical protein n=1 Tax=Pseudomonas syringae group genomosp. 7 TaxID=251699 RepID=UPI0037706076
MKSGFALFVESKFFVEIQFVQIQLDDLPGVIVFRRLVRPSFRLGLVRRQELWFGPVGDERQGGPGLLFGVVDG